MNVVLESKIKCPNCGFEKIEIMPEIACLHFYLCSGCSKIIAPLEGDCCVFCSYGTVKCPSIQKYRECC